MTANIANQVPFLRTARNFPAEIGQLSVEVNKSYIDIANVVNNRTISQFPVNRPLINGESWFLTGNRKQQGLRQVYDFTTMANIDLGFKIASVSRFVRLFGAFTDGTNWYGILGASNVAIAGQLSFYIFLNVGSTTSDQIAFLVGAGAPALIQGQVVVEWISEP